MLNKQLPTNVPTNLRGDTKCDLLGTWFPTRPPGMPAMMPKQQHVDRLQKRIKMESKSPSMPSVSPIDKQRVKHSQQKKKQCPAVAPFVCKDCGSVRAGTVLLRPAGAVGSGICYGALLSVR